MVKRTGRLDTMHLSRKSMENGNEFRGVRNMDKLALMYDKADNVTTTNVKTPLAIMDMMGEHYESTFDLRSPLSRNGFIRKDLQGTYDTGLHSDAQIGIRETLLAAEHPGSIISNYEENIIHDGIKELDAETKLAGLIFMCNKRTMKDCFHLSLFGLPFNMWDLVKEVVPGTILFLFEYEARQMWGIYEATTFGQLNIEPSAYKHSRGSFPAQVRFKELQKCPPLKEKEFKEAIWDNYWSDKKFDFELSQEQVNKLSRIFLSKLDDINLSSVNEDRTCSTLEVEEYVPLECNQLEMLDCYKGQVYGTPSDYCSTQRLRAALHRSLNDKSDKGLLSVKDNDVSYIERENGFLLMGNYPANFSDNGFEEKWNEFHSNGSIHSLYNNDVCILSSSNTEVDTVAKNRTRLLLDINTSEYIPTTSAGLVGSTQLMYERMMSERRKMSRAGMDSNVHNKASQLAHPDEVKHKPSVWYRISGRGTAPPVSPSTLHTEIGSQACNSTALPFTQDRLEKSITCYGDDVDSMHISSIRDEPTLSDQPEIEYPINFKRRKNPRDASISQDLEKTQEKKRRKLIRPDLLEPIQSCEERGKDSGSLQVEKPWSDEQYDLLQCKALNGNFTEGQRPAKKVNKSVNVVSLPPLELCERSTEKETVLCLNPSKGGKDQDVQNKSGCKEQNIHAGAQPEVSSQVAGEDSGSLEVGKPQTDQQYDMVQCKDINITFIEGRKPANKVNTTANVISLRPLELCERNTGKETVLCLNQFKGGNDQDVQNKNGCVDVQPKSSDQLTGNCSSGDQLAESGCSFERGAFMDTAAVAYDNLLKTESNSLDEHKTSEGRIVMNGVLEKGRERPISKSDMVMYEFNILEKADRSIVSGEVSRKKSLGVDLNLPLCPVEHDNVFVRCFPEDTDNTMNAKSSVTANDDNCGKVVSEPHLHLELTMLPSGLLSAALGEVVSGEASGHKVLVSQ